MAAAAVVFWATVCKTVRPMLSVRCLSVLACLSICDVRALWPNGWTDQDETWHAGRPQPWTHCVRWGIMLYTGVMIRLSVLIKLRLVSDGRTDTGP